MVLIMHPINGFKGGVFDQRTTQWEQSLLKKIEKIQNEGGSKGLILIRSRPAQSYIRTGSSPSSCNFSGCRSVAPEARYPFTFNLRYFLQLLQA